MATLELQVYTCRLMYMYTYTKASDTNLRGLCQRQLNHHVIKSWLHLQQRLPLHGQILITHYNTKTTPSQKWHMCIQFDNTVSWGELLGIHIECTCTHTHTHTYTHTHTHTHTYTHTHTHTHTHTYTHTYVHTHIHTHTHTCTHTLFCIYKNTMDAKSYSDS